MMDRDKRSAAENCRGTLFDFMVYINIRGLPFASNGFLLSSINDDSYGAFLSYKIESEVPDKDDVSFSFNV